MHRRVDSLETCFNLLIKLYKESLYIYTHAHTCAVTNMPVTIACCSYKRNMRSYRIDRGVVYCNIFLSPLSERGARKVLQRPTRRRAKRSRWPRLPLATSESTNEPSGIIDNRVGKELIQRPTVSDFIL